ncbi:MAG TPA: heparinase II/III family protein [Opitutaceae bacterium]
MELPFRSRAALRVVALLSLAALLVGPATAALPPALFETLPPHPRLLVNAERFEELRRQVETDPTSIRLYAALRRKADAFLNEPPVRHEKVGRRLLGQSRRCQERVLTLAFVARMSGDARYVDRAATEMRAAAAFKDWNTSHFLDTAEMTLALAIGYDWLQDQLSAEDRALVARAIVEKGLRPSIDGPPGELHWISGTNNWNQVCHAGLVAGALAVADAEPALARTITQRAVDNLPRAAAAYAPDGAYPEGPMYWNYGTTFHVILVDLLQSALGRTEGLDAAPGFMATADYIAQVTTPTARFFSYADARERRPLLVALFWFARQQRRPELLRFDLEHLDSLLERYEFGDGDEVYRLLTLALVWWRPESTAGSTHPGAVKTPPLSWLGRGGNPVALFRSAWGDPNAVYVGVKGGTPAASHAHMDVGSFILEANGVRWAVDPGLQEYESLESKGIHVFGRAQDAERWQVFRLGAEAHNVIRFNGAPQQVAGAGTIERFVGDGAARRAVVDLGSLYSEHVASARRGIALLTDRNVLVQDEWVAGEKPVAVAWQWLTQADAVVEGRDVTLRQSGQALRLRVLSPAEAKISVEDVSAPRQPYDAPNPGLRRVVVTTSTPAGASGRVQVLAIPSPGPAEVPELAGRALADW